MLIQTETTKILEPVVNLFHKFVDEEKLIDKIVNMSFCALNEKNMYKEFEKEFPPDEYKIINELNNNYFNLSSNKDEIQFKSEIGLLILRSKDYLMIEKPKFVENIGFKLNRLFNKTLSILGVNHIIKENISNTKFTKAVRLSDNSRIVYALDSPTIVSLNDTANTRDKVVYTEYERIDNFEFQFDENSIILVTLRNVDIITPIIIPQEGERKYKLEKLEKSLISKHSFKVSVKSQRDI